MFYLILLNWFICVCFLRFKRCVLGIIVYDDVICIVCKCKYTFVSKYCAVFLSLAIVLVTGVVYVKNNVYICMSCVINICNS